MRHRRADIAAVDVVCWALAERHESAAVRRLRVVQETPPRPALPFITAGTREHREVKLIRDALDIALASDDAASACQALLLTGISVLEHADYQLITTLSAGV